jgi:hypothetical protein
MVNPNAKHIPTNAKVLLRSSGFEISEIIAIDNWIFPVVKDEYPRLNHRQFWITRIVRIERQTAKAAWKQCSQS